MLAQAVNVILDFVGARTYSARMIRCEVVSHAAFGVRRSFGIFFGVIRPATLQNILGADWSAEMDDAWSELLGELDYFVTSRSAAGCRFGLMFHAGLAQDVHSRRRQAALALIGSGFPVGIPGICGEGFMGRLGSQVSVRDWVIAS